jgi:hypothetical protein
VFAPISAGSSRRRRDFIARELFMWRGDNPHFTSQGQT